MLELGRKEQHVMGALGVQILIVGLLVFAYTQAVRQVKLGRELSARFQEQLTVAREQVARQGGRSEVAALQAQVEELKASLAAPDALDVQANRLKRLAARFGIRDAQVAAESAPTEKITVPLEGQPDFEIRLHSLEMKGTASTRSIAGLAAAVADPVFKPISPLVGMRLEEAPAGENQPVKFTLRWLIAVSPGSPAGMNQELPSSGTPPAWGRREEPFLSPFSHPSALRLSGDKKVDLHLSGILLEGAAPASCVINQQVLKAGDWVEGFQVVLITPEAVLLEGKEEELLLRLP